MAILSIQSAVAYGHVGNSAAVFPLQRLGFEVWPVDTVQFSNHTGYGAWRGRAWDAATIAEVLRGIAERGVLAGCAAVLSGYLGEPALGAAVLDAVAAAKAANPAALYCCDPVIGDDGKGVFVRPGIAEFLRDRAVPASDLLTPNRFELEFLAGRRVASLEEALVAADLLRARGPRLVLATSLPSAASDELAMLAVAAEEAWRVATPRLPLAGNGAGDLTAALFLGHFLRSGNPGAALGATASAVHAVLEATLAAGGGELALVATQDALASPPRRFAPKRVR
jgi:pyridoxine kinase